MECRLENASKTENKNENNKNNNNDDNNDYRYRNNRIIRAPARL